MSVDVYKVTQWAIIGLQMMNINMPAFEKYAGSLMIKEEASVSKGRSEEPGVA